MAQKTTRNWSGNYKSAEDKAYDRFTDVIIDNINRMKNSNWQEPWFSTNVKMGLPRNYDGRPYNGVNSLLLMLYSNFKKFKSLVFITSSKVNSLNYKLEEGKKPVPLRDANGNNLPFVHILKGEKSFPVFLYFPVSARDKSDGSKISLDEYNKLSTHEQENYNLLFTNKVYNVFNIDQTNLNEARPKEYSKLTAIQESSNVSEEMFSFPAVDQMIQDNLWICPIYTNSVNGCYYAPGSNSVSVPPKEQFKDGEYFYTSLFHELAHSTGHPDYLNREGITNLSALGSDNYAHEELVAELTAALVGNKYGLTKHIKEDSSAYLKGWLHSLREEPSFLKTILGDVKNASVIINKHIDDIQKKIDKEQDINNTTALPLDKKNSDNESSTDIDIQSEDSIIGVDVDGNGTIDKMEVFSDQSPDKKQGANEQTNQKSDPSPQHSHHR